MSTIRTPLTMYLEVSQKERLNDLSEYLDKPVTQIIRDVIRKELSKYDEILNKLERKNGPKAKGH